MTGMWAMDINDRQQIPVVCGQCSMCSMGYLEQPATLDCLGCLSVATELPDWLGVKEKGKYSDAQSSGP